jgi:septal ring factor EnvC (AmiA/AmiB activator)
MSDVVQLPLLPGIEPAIGLVRRQPFPVEKQIAEKRQRVERIEDDIEDLRSERSDLESEIENLEKMLSRQRDQEGPGFPVELFNDSLAGPERDFLQYVAANGCEDERDEKRLRAIIQNHAGWWERVAA